MARAVTSADALIELRTDLSQLSNTLHEVFDLMTADMSNIGQEWQDGQYEQFREAYSKQINRCEEVSVDYKAWCSLLDTTIANVESVEQTKVVSEGGGSFSGGIATAAGIAGVAGLGAIGVAAMASNPRMSSGKSGNFNIGMNGGMSPVPPASNQAQAQTQWEQQHQMSFDSQNYYIDQNGNAVRKPAGFNIGELDNSSNRSTTITSDASKIVDTLNGNKTNTSASVTPEASKIVDTLNGNKTNTSASVNPDASKIVDALNGGKTNEFGSNVGVSPAPNQVEAQQKWEEEHQMSLDAQNYYIDQNGNVVRKPVGFNMGVIDNGPNNPATVTPDTPPSANVVNEVESNPTDSTPKYSSNLESWMNETLKPSTPKPSAEQGPMISKIIEGQGSKTSTDSTPKYSSNLESWMNETLKPSTPKPSAEQGPMISKIIGDSDTKKQVVHSDIVSGEAPTIANEVLQSQSQNPTVATTPNDSNVGRQTQPMLDSVPPAKNNNINDEFQQQQNTPIHQNPSPSAPLDDPSKQVNPSTVNPSIQNNGGNAGSKPEATPNPSGINDIPYTPFPEPADTHKDNPPQKFNPIIEPEQGTPHRRSKFGGILNSSHSHRESPRNRIQQEEIDKQKRHHRKDRFNR